MSTSLAAKWQDRQNMTSQHALAADHLREEPDRVVWKPQESLAI